MNKLYRTSLIALTLTFLLFATSFGQAPAAMTADKWREDLRLMAAQMEARHKNLYHTVSREQFQSAVKKLDERIPTLTRNQIIVEMMRLVAMVGDGHSNIYPTRDAKIAFRTLPIKMYLFKDGMFIRSAKRGHSGLVGSRVVKIGGVAVGDAVSMIKGIVGHDTEMGVRYFAPILLAMPEVLNGLGITPTDESVSFTIDRSGTRSVVDLKPIGPVEIAPADTDLSWMPKEGWVDMRDSAAGPTPLWLKDAKNMLWYEYLPGSKVLYAQINQVGNKKDVSFADFSKRLLAFVDANPVDKLVIDLRLNRGGDGTLLRPLEVGLIKSKIDQRGKLFVLMGRSTWSASQFFLNRAEKYTSAIFVGEPSASKGNVYGDSRRITLPNSGITARVSVYYWQDWEPWDTRRWSAPEITAELSSAEYAANVDPALNAVLRYSERKPLDKILDEAITEGGAALAVKRFREFRAEPVNKFADAEEALLNAGQRLLNEKKPDQALLIFELYKGENPDSFRSYYAVGAAYAAMGKKAEAIRGLEKALELNPKEYDISMMLENLRKQ